ncbi:pyridoxal phosphate-dependent decarboxylase family protein [Gallaecimonas mangrovi]|uniref:pyridoxal phosphate-dependent decarboxylase family protein n=1 Tax=Gallaecimonas mangrovi TaxID=2291597 RepID=UPI000E207CA4|nr:aspartate aminotransferase family protein [Gallaecimonas mangrovi]
MDNAQPNSLVKAGGLSSDPTAFLFNDQQLGLYRQHLEKGLALVEKRLTATAKPFSGKTPRALAKAFSKLDLNTPLSDVNAALTELEQLYLDDAVYFHHRHYVAHLNCPVVVPSLLAELILSALNTSVDTWDQSGGATFIEQSLVDWTAKRIGFDQDADGIFTSGGTQSNLMAMLLARDNACQQYFGHNVREHGLPPEAKRLQIFCSELSHFSIQKAAALLGLGYDAVVAVPCDRHFAMDIAALNTALEAAKAAGKLPMAVVATAGTTDFGSIDPIAKVAKVAKEVGAWCHVDAAYGCGLLVSSKQRWRLSGIELADSVTVDYHKAFFQPVSCSALLVKNKAHLSVVTWHADYLNPLSQRQEGTPNLVDKSLQTTRRFDALKLWLTLRIMGADAIGQGFEAAMLLARRTYLLLLSEPDIEVLHQPQLSAVVFRFRPAGLVGDWDRLNKAIRQAVMASGQAMIAATQVKGRQYLKFTLLNPATTISDMQGVVEMIKQQGQRLLAQFSEHHNLEEVAHG